MPAPPNTLAWYEQNAQTFATESMQVDLAAIREAFVQHLPEAGRILDLGCGAGRDTLAFLRLGYRVRAMDASPVMAAIARENTGLDVEVAKAQEIEAQERFDGIWACASLLHVPASETPSTLRKLRNALVPGGVLYVSYKSGAGERVRDGRLFNDVEPAKLRGLLQAAELRVLRVWDTPDARPERAAERWTNGLAVR